MEIVAAGAAALLELRTLVDGRLALPVYGSATSLVRCCADAQPYGVFPASALAGLVETCGADVVDADLPLPPELRRTASRAPGDPVAAATNVVETDDAALALLNDPA